MATQEQLVCFPLAQTAPVPLDGSLAAIAPAGNGGGAPITVAITDPGLDLAKRTVCIKVRLSTMGNTRKVSTSQIEADADKDLLRVSKHLLAPAELKAIGRFDGEIRRFLYNICLPFEIGIHLLPIAALETVESRLRQFAEDRKQLVAAFIKGQSFPLFNLLLSPDCCSLLRYLRIDDVNFVANIDTVSDRALVAIFADYVLVKEAVGSVVGRRRKANEVGVEVIR